MFKNKKNIFKECLLERSKQAIQTDFNVLSYHDSLHKNIKKIVTSLYESGLTTIPMYRLLIKVNLIEQNILNIFKRDISQITDQLRIFIEGLKIRYNLKEFESDDLINIITINCFQNAFSLLIVTQGNPNKDQIQTAINDLTSHYESLVLETTND